MEELFPAAPSAPGPFIMKVTVDGLFNEFSYDLRFDSTYGFRLGLLSGANGTGKTTLLRMLRAALTRSPGKFKGVLRKVQFRTFEIELANGLRIGFKRSDDATTGPFVYYVTDGNTTHELNFRGSSSMEEDFESRDELLAESTEEATTVEEISNVLRKKAPSLVYLPTDRDTSAEARTVSAANRRQGGAGVNLRGSVDGFTRRLLLRATQQSNQGEVAAYDVLNATVETAITASEPELTPADLTAFLEAHSERVARYSHFGLTKPIDPKPIVAKIKVASTTQFRAIATVVQPYLELQEARLDSLKQLYELLNTFSQVMNSFLYPKRLECSLLDGLQIFKKDEMLPLGALSSGERQLLMLFTRSVGLTSPYNVVLIDEPELSLNGNWTRLLLRSLLSETLSSGTQFIMATHSVELATQYENALLSLN